MTAKDIKQFIEKYDNILIVQADNPDGDSLASTLALEQILGDLGKEPKLYCGVDIPTYLRYLRGWDRVSRDVPASFDGSIIVDTTASNLFEASEKAGALAWIKSKPSIIIDHHDTKPTIKFTRKIYQKPAVACGELLYDIAKTNGWKLNQTAREMIVAAILSDSLGLISESTTAHSVRVVADLVEDGVSLAKLDNERKLFQKKSPEILKYKGELISRVSYSDDGRIAIINIPWPEIEKYSHQYNPSMLVLDEMRQVENVALAVAFKTYPNGRITAKLRANYGHPVAGPVAEKFGGGGHPYASGFRINSGKSYDELKNEVIAYAQSLLKNESGKS